MTLMIMIEVVLLNFGPNKDKNNGGLRKSSDRRFSLKRSQTTKIVL